MKIPSSHPKTQDGTAGVFNAEASNFFQGVKFDAEIAEKGRFGMKTT